MKNHKEKRVGNYIVKKTIGSGSFAVVELAYHYKLKNEVAIKRISKKKININKNFSRCLNEISIYKKLNHPNIIKIFDVIDQGRYLCLIMEYASEGDIVNFLQKYGKMQEKEVRYYFRQLINGIEFAHLNGIAHRDLKLENILLNSNNVLKIADFGLASQLKEGKFMKTCCGTIRYADPEILKGRRYSGELSDVWSCGIILFTMLCGYLPFEDDVYGIILKKIIKCDIDISEGVSEDA